MGTKWTEQQLRAIEERNGNILVAAAAGSGKTAVLIERILEIIKHNIDIDKMLIVTYTNAAAAEMKDRLYMALQKELDSDTISPEMMNRLTRQQMLLSKSHITTIHSFCQSVIKSNTVESGIDASFKIADTGEIQILRSDIMSEIFEKRYSEKNKRFLRLVEIYGDYRSDKKLEETIFSMFDFAQGSPDPEQWLEAQKRTFDTNFIKDFSETNWFKEILKDIYITFMSFYESMRSLYDTAVRLEITEYIKTLEGDTNKIYKFIQFIDNARNYKNNQLKWDDIFNVFELMEFESIPRIKKDSEYDEYALNAIEKIKKERNDIKRKIKNSFSEKIGSSADAPIKDIEVLQEDMEEIIDIAIDFCRAYAAEKKEKHMLDFGDLEHIAYKTLAATDENGNVVKSNVAKRYSEYFEEIYIDEYQDTSEIQEAILTLVSRNGTEKKANTFRVGDVKQSIYGFRQARPDIFIDKYTKYGADGVNDKLIILNKNFRSRETVLKSVNNVFSKIMTENTCSMEYTEAEYLNFGAEYYPETDSDTTTEIHLCRSSESKEKYEPEIVANIIKKLVDEKHQVSDKRTGKMRDISYKDIVILLRSYNKADLFVQKMKERGIPAFYKKDGGFFENAEINIMLSFMKTVDNPLQDIHFVATMRNIYGFTDNQLACIKNYGNKSNLKDEYFYNMCKLYDEDDDLKEKLGIFITRIEELREIAKHSSVSELLWILMHENRFYENLYNGPFGELHRANINMLYSKAINYDIGTNKGLFRFLYYFDKLKKKKTDMSSASSISENMDAVNIMSIHKSKGLEFPVVIIAETGTKFSDKDLKKPLLMHRLVGFGPYCYLENEKVKYPSVLRFCVGRRILADNMAEEMRVLYVGMTRASEKLIITGSIDKNIEQYISECKSKCSVITGKPLEYHILNSKSMIDWLMLCDTTDENHIFYHDESLEVQCGEEESETVTDDVYVLPQPQMSFYKEPLSKADTAIPAKISVSDLKRFYDKENDGESYKQKETVKMLDMSGLLESEKEENTTIGASELGTAIHSCLQLTDYGHLKDLSNDEAEKYAEEIILEAIDKGFIKKDVADKIDTKMIACFYCSSTAKKISNADEIFKEIPFTQLEDIDGVQTAVQGVIDLLIREGEEYTVIDFKTDARPDAQKHQQQLYYYGQCVRKTFGREPQKMIYFIKHNKEVLI